MHCALLSLFFVFSELKKRLFCEKKNDHFEVESFVKCAKCGRKFHQICVLYVEEANTAVYVAIIRINFVI